MLYFPTEHDWSLTVRPDRIPIEDKFPTKYTVNAIPLGGGKSQGPGAGQQRRGKKRSIGGKAGKDVHINPNHIPINHIREEGELQDKGEYWHMERLGQGKELDYSDWNTPHDIPGW